MIKYIGIICVLCLLGCNGGPENNYLLIERNGFELFRSNPIDRVSVIGSRVYIDLDYEDREVLAGLGEVYDDPVLVDIFIGESLYTELLLNFQMDFLSDSRISLPLEKERMDIFNEAGIRVRK